MNDAMMQFKYKNKLAKHVVSIMPHLSKSEKIQNSARCNVWYGTPDFQLLWRK